MGITTDFDTEIPIIQNWLKTQYHLPQCIDEILLKRFICASQGDLERTKNLLELNYSMRTNYSHIFLQRDPCNESAQKILEITDMLILPGLTATGNKLLFYRLVDTDPEKFNFNEAIKMFFMFADLRFITPDSSGLSTGEVPIFDMAGFGLRHLGKIILSTLRIYMKFTQEAHPVRLKEIHVINCPSYLDKVLMVIKPFMKSEVFKLMKFHLPDSDTLYKYVRRDMLPNEYGGKAGEINTIKMEWIERLKDRRNYLMNEKYWKINEANRSLTKQTQNQLKKNNNNNNIEGNFRTLCID